MEHMPRITELDVNGSKRRVDADAERTLLSVLRDDLDLTGTKYGCGEGQCAACTVLVEGQPTRSCITKVGTAAGKRIVTIEGLAPEGKLHPMQEAFIRADAMQCGWCTPGMILAALSLEQTEQTPTLDEVKTALAGNLCRCTGYSAIYRAVMKWRDANPESGNAAREAAT